MRVLRSLGLALVCASLPGCIEASQEPVRYDAVAVPRGHGTATVDGWTVILSRGDVALGPFYFCAATTTVCASAIAELTRVHVVNAIASTPTPLGAIRGFSGPLRSATYDFGISWFDTQPRATPAPELPSGHSIHLEGEARKGDVLVPFVADVDVVPQYRGQQAIATSPTSGEVISSATRLEIIVDPAAWLKQVDFDAMAKSVTGGNAPFVIRPGMPEHDAILLGIKSLAPVELRWASAAQP